MHSTNSQNVSCQSPKMVDSAKNREEEVADCVVEAESEAVQEDEPVCCKAEPEYEDPTVSQKQRQTIVITDSPSPAGSVISISSGTDEEVPDTQKHALE